MQEINYSDVKLGKESEDLRKALGWMNVDWYTFCVRGKSYLRVTHFSPLFCPLFLQIFLQFIFKCFYTLLHFSL